MHHVFLGTLHAWVAMLHPFLGMLYAWVAMLSPFLVTLYAWVAMLSPFLGMLYAWVAMLHPFLGILHAWVAMLHPFLGMLYAWVAMLHPFLGMLYAWVAMLSPFLGMLYAWVAMLSPFLGVPARVRRDAPPVRRASPPAACNSSSKSTSWPAARRARPRHRCEPRPSLRRWGRVAASALVVGASLAARSAIAEETESVHLVYRAPALCPSAGELIAKLRGLSPRIRIDDSAGAARVLEVTIDDDGLHGKMAVTKDGAASGAREVAAGTCSSSSPATSEKALQSPCRGRRERRSGSRAFWPPWRVALRACRSVLSIFAPAFASKGANAPQRAKASRTLKASRVRGLRSG
jgi:hypothetical protein